MVSIVLYIFMLFLKLSHKFIQIYFYSKRNNRIFVHYILSLPVLIAKGGHDFFGYFKIMIYVLNIIEVFKFFDYSQYFF